MLALAFEVEIKNIMADVMNRSKQHYLDLRITKPEPSNLKLGLLYLYLYSNSHTIDELRPMCSAAGLIQIGLDIHEWVTNERLNSPAKLETRQLQVLAGDYFSSLYYRLLATLGDRDTIHKIAQSVRRINQQKVIYYQQKEEIANNFDLWLSSITEIELGLFYGFLSSDDQVWVLLFEHFITLDILYNNPYISKWNQRYLQQRIQASIKKIRENIKKVGNVEVIYELQKYLLQYEHMSVPSLVAEEI